MDGVEIGPLTDPRCRVTGRRGILEADYQTTVGVFRIAELDRTISRFMPEKSAGSDFDPFIFMSDPASAMSHQLNVFRPFGDFFSSRLGFPLMMIVGNAGQGHGWRRMKMEKIIGFCNFVNLKSD